MKRISILTYSVTFLCNLTVWNKVLYLLGMWAHKHTYAHMSTHTSAHTHTHMHTHREKIYTPKSMHSFASSQDTINQVPVFCYPLRPYYFRGNILLGKSTGIRSDKTEERHHLCSSVVIPKSNIKDMEWIRSKSINLNKIHTLSTHSKQCPYSPRPKSLENEKN